jgi:hypothetical protein
MALCQIHERERRQKETKGQTDSGKTANLKTGKAPAHGYSGRSGTLGRFEDNCKEYTSEVARS